MMMVMITTTPNKIFPLWYFHIMCLITLRGEDSHKKDVSGRLNIFTLYHLPKNKDTHLTLVLEGMG